MTRAQQIDQARRLLRRALIQLDRSGPHQHQSACRAVERRKRQLNHLLNQER